MRFSTPTAIRLAAALLVLLAPNVARAQFLLDSLPVWTAVDSIESSPSVAFDGNNYIAVWQLLNRRHEDIRAGRITPGGQVLDPQGIEVTNDTFEQRAPTIAAGNGLSLVVWQDWRRVWVADIRAARIDTGGRVLDSSGFVVVSGHRGTGTPAVAFGHGRWLVAWDEAGHNRDIKAVLVDSLGSVGAPIVVSGFDWHESLPSVAATVSGFIVAWEDRRNGSYPQVYCARVDTTGVLLDSAGLSLWTDRYSQNRPLTAAIGDTALVAWEEEAVVDSDVWGMRIDAAGVLLDTAPIRIVAGPGRPSGFCLAARGDDYIVLWPTTLGSTEGRDLWGVRVRSDGTVRDPSGIPFVRLTGEQDQPVVVFGDSQTLLVWRDDEGDSAMPDIKAARLDASDSILDPAGIMVTALGDYRYFEQYNPAVASDGSNYLVAWTDMRHRSTKPDVYCNRVYQSGMTRDSAALQVCRAPGVQDSVKLAYCRGRYLAVWLDRRTGARAVRAVRLDSTGRRVDAEDLSLAGDYVNGLDLCAGDSGWVVTWCAAGRGGALDVKATFVGIDGDIPAPDGWFITDTDDAELLPAIAYNGQTYFVSWGVYRNIQLNYEIAGVVLSGDSLRPSLTQYVSSMPGRDEFVKLAGMNDGAIAVWLNRYPTTYTSLLTARLDSAGVAVDSPPVSLAFANRSFGPPVVVRGDSIYYVLWQWKIDDVFWRHWGAILSTEGIVLDTFALAPSESTLWSAGAATAGSGALLVYPKVLDFLGVLPVMCRRILGLQSPFGGITEVTEQDLARLSAIPNPFRMAVRIVLPPCACHVLGIYDATGRRVSAVTTGGRGVVTWDGRDDTGTVVAPGVYFASAGDGEAPLRLIRLR